MKLDTKEGIVVAPGQQSDASALARLHAACFTRGWDGESMRQFLGDPACTVLVAGQPGETDPQGLLIFRVTEGEAEILTLAVAPGARGQGIGEALWQTARKELQPQGVSRAVLEVGESNAVALALYRKLGFREVGRRKDYYQGASGEPRQDGLTMACDLATSGSP